MPKRLHEFLRSHVWIGSHSSLNTIVASCVTRCVLIYNIIRHINLRLHTPCGRVVCVCVLPYTKKSVPWLFRRVRGEELDLWGSARPLSHQLTESLSSTIICPYIWGFRGLWGFVKLVIGSLSWGKDWLAMPHRWRRGPPRGRPELLEGCYPSYKPSEYLHSDYLMGFDESNRISHPTLSADGSSEQGEEEEQAAFPQ